MHSVSQLLLNWTEIEANIVDLSEFDAAILSLESNIVRKSLKQIEEGKPIKNMMDKFNLTQKQKQITQEQINALNPATQSTLFPPKPPKPSPFPASQGLARFIKPSFNFFEIQVPPFFSFHKWSYSFLVYTAISFNIQNVPR